MDRCLKCRPILKLEKSYYATKITALTSFAVSVHFRVLAQVVSLLPEDEAEMKVKAIYP